MIQALLIFAIINLALVVYVYFGYPLLLLVLSKLIPGREIKKSNIRPHVSLLISCYNEEAVIRKKLENAIALDYPKDKIEIIVISDGSTDQTDQIVKEFSRDGVHLVRQEGRLGKTSGINLGMEKAKGEIVVFSDANAIYKEDAIIHLVENFHDPTVGYVVGEAQYENVYKSAASRSENTYWNYEILIKKLESQIHSMVGGDGAIYAIRKYLYEPLLRTDINDFVNPLQIIAKGYRGIYEPAAICLEETAGAFEKEFKRKARIVNRSFNGFCRVKTVINPKITGIYSIQILSHKVLRWFTGFFCANFFASSLFIALMTDSFLFQLIVLAELIILSCAYLGFLYRDFDKPPVFLYYPYYFVIVNTAAIKGIYQSIRGDIKITWEPHRSIEKHEREKRSNIILVHGLAVIVLICFLLIIGRIFTLENLLWHFSFWACLIILAHTYFGYPLIIYIWSKISPNPNKKRDFTPDVALIICAYNEEEVIDEKLKNCIELDYPNEKITFIVLSDGSDDQTVEIIKRFRDKRITLYEYAERSGKIGVINRTIPQLSSDILIFTDANTMLKSDAVQKLVRNFYDERVGAVSANVILENQHRKLGKGEWLYYKYERFIQKKESLIESLVGADGGLYAIRRDLFRAPSSNTIIDDFVISMNIATNGYRLVYEPAAEGYEVNSNTPMEEFIRKSRVIAGAIQSLKNGQGIPRIRQKKLFFSYLSHKFLRWLSPLLIIVLSASILILVISGQSLIYSIVLVGEVAFFLLAAVGFLIKEKNMGVFISLPYYFCIENASALYGIYKGMFNRQSVMWNKLSRKCGSRTVR